MWRNPVGEGAKRVTTVIVTAIPIWTARMVSAHITHQDPPCTPAGEMIGSHALQTEAHGIAGAWAGMWAGIRWGAGPGWRNPFRLLRSCFTAERERWILWAPVGI